MRGAILRWATGWMQRESKERQSTNPFQRSYCLGLRRHSAAKRFATGYERMFGKYSQRCIHSGPDCCLRQLWWIGPLSTTLHVRKLVAQRADAAAGKLCGDGTHEGMIHSSAGTMR